MKRMSCMMRGSSDLCVLPTSLRIPSLVTIYSIIYLTRAIGSTQVIQVGFHGLSVYSSHS